MQLSAIDLQGLRHPRHRAHHARRRGRRGARQGLRQRGARGRREDGGGRARRPPVGPGAGRRPDPRPGGHRRRRDRRRRGHHARCSTSRPTRCATSGIQVTGSHNPKDYNGFKMVLAGRAIYGDEIQGLRQRDGSRQRQARPRRQRAQRRRARGLPQRIVGDVKLARPMKIVVDSGNGIAGASAPGHLPRHRLRGDRALQRGRRQLSQSPSRPEQAREPQGPDRGAGSTATPSWAWPSTATATAWASSPRTGRTSTPTAR